MKESIVFCGNRFRKINILNEGLRLLTAVGAPEVVKNACGETVRPGDTQAGLDEAGIA